MKTTWEGQAMRKLLVLILAFALLIPGALAEIRHEGPGYDTPEEAVLAYVEALKSYLQVESK